MSSPELAVGPDERSAGLTDVPKVGGRVGEAEDGRPTRGQSHGALVRAPSSTVRRPQALALQGLVGNRAVARLLQRNSDGGCGVACDCASCKAKADDETALQRIMRTPASSTGIHRKTDVEAAIEADNGDAIAKLPTASLQKATDDQKIKMIGIILAKGVATDRLPLLWDIKPAVIEANVGQWQATWTKYASLMANHPLRKVFEFDTADVAKSMMAESQVLLEAHLEHYGLSEGSDKAGQNTADRQSSIDYVQKGAQEIAGAQAQLRAMLQVKIPNDKIYWQGQGLPGKPDEPFDPDVKPPLASKEGLALWEQVRKPYKEVEGAIDDYLEAVPELYPIVMSGTSSKREAYSDPGSTLATGEKPLEQIEKSIRQTLKNIKDSEGLVPVLARDRKLGPVEQQLLAGTKVIDPKRNWKNAPVYAAMVPTITAPASLGKTIGEMAVMVAVQVALAAATGGIGNALLSGAQVAGSVAERGVLQTASDTSMSSKNAIVDKREVAAANLAVVMDAAFAVFDLVPGLKQAKGVWGAARGEARAAAAAAEQLEKQALQLETKLLAKAEKAEIATLEKAMKEQLATAEKALADAKAKLPKAGEQEAKLIAIEIKKAEESVAKAKAIAGGAHGGEELTVVIGERTYRWSPGLGLVICASPCEKAVAKLDALGPKLVAEVRLHSASGAEQLQGRVAAARQHMVQLDTELLNKKQLTRPELEKVASHAESLLTEVEAQKRFAMLQFGNDAEALAAARAGRPAPLTAGGQWKTAVLDEIKGRKAAIEAADRKFFGSNPVELEKVLEARRAEWEAKIAPIARDIDAEGKAATPNGTNRSTLMTNLDTALSNFEREVRGQRTLVMEGGELKALTDAEASRLLGTQLQLDYVAVKDGKLILGDSKGIGDVSKSIEQINQALASRSEFARKFIDKGAVEARVYLSYAEFEQRGYRAIGHPPLLSQMIEGKLTQVKVAGGLPLHVVFN